MMMEYGDPTKLEARTYGPYNIVRAVKIQRNQHVQETVNIRKIFPIEERNPNPQYRMVRSWWEIVQRMRYQAGIQD